jgi:hypothetical protein
LDADHAMNAECVARGLIQAARFTPEAYQERLRALYANVGATI